MVSSAIANPFPEASAVWSLPYRGKVAMAGLIVAESAIFTIFVVAYLFYVGKSLTGPTPREVLETPIFYTICLLSSSLTVHLAAKSLARARVGAFLGLWVLTIVLGGTFMYGTGQDLRTRAHDLDQFIWNNVLLVGRTARLSRHRWPDHALDCRDLRFGRTRAPAAVVSRGGPRDVLALCGCRVGGGFHCCLRAGPLRLGYLRKNNGNLADNRTNQ
jgi:hypothetical protein